MNKYVVVLIGSLFSLSTQAQTDSSQDFYAALEASHSRLEISSTEFNPPAVGLRAGWYVQPQVGIELNALTGVENDDIKGLDTELESSLGISLRLESSQSKEGARVFFLLGYATTSISLEQIGTGQPGSHDFDGVTYGGGLEFPLNKSETILWDVKYQKNYHNDGIDLDFISSGLRFRF